MPVFNFFGGPNIDKMKAKGDIKGLIKAVDSSDKETYLKAIRALGELGTDQAFAKLIDLLSQMSTYSQAEAEKTLISAGPRAVDPLIAALQSENTNIRRRAVKLLGVIGDARAVAPLIALFDARDSYKIAEYVEEALQKIGMPAVKPLQAVLEKKRMPFSAINALLKIGDPQSVPLIIKALKTDLKHPDSRIREIVARELGKTGDARAVPVLLPLLTDPVVKVRLEAVGALEKTGAAAAGALQTALADADGEVRAAAARALQKLGQSAPTFDCLGVRFNINKISSGAYAEECWKIFWRAVDIQLVGGCSLFEGDSNDTPARENVYCVGIRWNFGPGQADAVCAALDRSEEFNRVAATPRYLDTAQVEKEPLRSDGEVDRSGKISVTSHRALPAYDKRRELVAIKDASTEDRGVRIEPDAPLDLDALTYRLERLLVGSLTPESRAEITAIGERLNQQGGMALMRQIGMRIQERSPLLGSLLENAWDGVGYWQA